MGLMVMGLWALWAGLKPDEEASDTREEASGTREEASGMREEASGMREEASGMREEASGTGGRERKKLLVCLERKEKTCIFAS